MISKHIHGCFMSMDYRIVGNFEGENFRKLVKNTIFAEKTFADCSLLLHQRTPRSQISRRKLS